MKDCRKTINALERRKYTNHYPIIISLPLLTHNVPAEGFESVNLGFLMLGPI